MKSDVVASTFLDLIFLTIHLSLRLRQERNVLLFFFLFFNLQNLILILLFVASLGLFESGELPKN